MRLTLVAALALLALPALAQDPTVYTGCLKSADGTLYSVRVGTTPMAPCKSKDKGISWNMAGQPGPPGPPGPSLPPALWIDANCDAGESINTALGQQAEMLTVSIRGTCHEEVVVKRDHVILQAQDANDPPTLTHEVNPLTVRGRDVALYNLKITGGASGNGVQIANSDVLLAACEIWNSVHGVLADASAVAISDGWVHDNQGFGVLVSGSSSLSIGSTRVENNDTGIGGQASGLLIVSTTILDNHIGIALGPGAHARLEGGEVSGSNEGLDVNSGSDAEIVGTAFTRNTSVAIGGEGSVSVKLSGGVTVSDNPGGGIGLSNGASLAFRNTNSITRNGVGISMFNSAFHAFSAGEMQVFGNGDGIRCTLSSGACVQSDITDSVSGCGPMCPDQADQP